MKISIPMVSGYRLMHRLIAICSLALFMVAGLISASETRRVFDIPSQSLSVSLLEFSEQTGISVIAAGAVVEGRTATAVKGTYSLEEALEQMLENSGVYFEFRDNTTLLIHEITEGKNQHGNKELRGAALTESQLTEEARVLPGNGATTAQQRELANEKDTFAVDEVVVVGTRIPGAGLSVPVTVMTRADFSKAGFVRLEDVFEDLPQNFDELTPDGRFANEGGSQLRGLNNTRVSAVDLRGLGAQSTLTLVNGSRRAGSIDGRVVDISAIPLSVIERVEIVTGGRSAIYGADAVAGVVNLVTRSSFRGSESQAYLGANKDGGERVQLSHIFGVESDRGGFVGAYDFERDRPLELGEAGLLSLEPNPEIGVTQLSLNAQTDTWRHSGYASGRYDLTDRINIRADALYTRKEFDDFSLRYFEGATEDSFTDTRHESDHISLSGGLLSQLGNDWTLDVSGAWSTVKNDSRSSFFIDVFGLFTIENAAKNQGRSTLSTTSVVFEGPLFSVANITPRAALGVEWRREAFKKEIDDITQTDRSRNVRSAFLELQLPIIEDGSMPGMRRLEFSLAGRYDDYSDFGGTFNPQVGAIWEPVHGLTVRGAFSTALRAPALVELNPSTDAFLELASDPMQGGALVPILFQQGERPDLEPEEAETWTLGVDWNPEVAPWLTVSVAYFDIEYDGRIEQPSVNADRELILEREDRFPGLVTRNLTPEEAALILAADEDGFISNDTGTPFDPATQNILDVFPNLISFDNRLANVAVEKLRGLDFNIDTTFDTSMGTLNFGAKLSRFKQHDRYVTSNSPAISLLNEVGKAVDTRIRGQAGWSKGAYGAYLHLNYVDDYKNPFSTPNSMIDSWTTLDLTLLFDGSKLGSNSFWNGITATFSVDNVMDKEPPFFPNSLLGLLYDSTNANPYGRYFSLRLTKQW